MGSVPWRLKSTLFRFADIVGPRPLYLAQKYVTRRARLPITGIKSSWAFHAEHLRAHRATEILEFGAGKSLAQNIYLAQFGIRQTLVDLNPMLDLDLVNRSIAHLSQLGVPTRGTVTSLDDLSTRYAIRYHAPMDVAQTSFADTQFDAIVSTNTLEHIPAPVIRKIWLEARRLLRPGGIVSAKIDYSDHYAHTDRRIGRLNYLTFTEAEWQRHNHANHYQNRLRHQHHLSLLEDAGFRVLHHAVMDPLDLPAGAKQQNLTGAETDTFTTGFVVATHGATS